MTSGSKSLSSFEDEEDTEVTEPELECSDCGQHRVLHISYTIEDLDAPERGQSGRVEGHDYRSFLSPEDALRDLRKHAKQGAEIHWELHGSRLNVESSNCARCSSQSMNRGEERRQPERGDLRKHHSAETERWSLRPDTKRELRKHASDDSCIASEPVGIPCVPEVPANPRQRCTCSRVPTSTTPAEPRTSWALAPQLSLPAPHRKPRLADESKTRSLRERTHSGPESRLLRRLLSPGASHGEARWTPCEACSPLSSLGMHHRETRRLGDIVWEPVDEEPRGSSNFRSVTPPPLPPVASPTHDEEDELRWHLLNQVSAFPIYQGAWREISPPLWSPRVPDMSTNSPSASPKLPRCQNVRERAKSEEDARAEKPGRQRPQLVRSEALLEVPCREPGKRSLSEDVRGWTSIGCKKNPPVFRARSEEVTRYEEAECQELREYVTTV